MKKFANTISTSKLVENVVDRMMTNRKQASVSNVEATPNGQYVTKKLQHTGEGYTDTSETSYIQQQRRDALNQGPNTGPIVEKTTLPDDRTNNDGLPAEDIFDVFESMGEPTQEVTDPGNLGDDPVSDKLKLKKDASAVFAKYDDVVKQGNQIIEYLTNYTVQSAKQASIAPYSAQEVVPNKEQADRIKTAMLNMVENAIYGAELMAIKVAEDIQANDEGMGAGELPPQLPPESIEALSEPVAGGEAAAEAGDGGGITEDDIVAIVQELEQAGLDEEQIMEVVSELVNGGGEEVAGEPVGEPAVDGGEAMLTAPEDAGLVPLDEGAAKLGEADDEQEPEPSNDSGDAPEPPEPSEPAGEGSPEPAVDESVLEPSADPALEPPADPALGGEEMGGDEETDLALIQALLEQGLSPEEVIQVLETEVGADASQADISPDDSMAIEAALAEAGISPEETEAAMAELQAEESAGVNPEEAMALESEVAKTGSYKYASFIGRPATKTANEERRASVVRKFVREFVYGPQARNFN
jgi:hypothetical protein